MNGLTAIIKRELLSYFQTPLAYIFMMVFIICNGAFTFYLDDYFERGIADMVPFFRWHPWLYVFLVPAISMRLWAEERKSGTVELLTTLPLSLATCVIGKFIASWLFIIMTLLATTPVWVSANYLGAPDNGVIALSYAGSALMAGAYLAIGNAMSACTSNQVIAFVLGAVLCLALTMTGFPLIINFLSGWLPQTALTLLGSLSFLTHFQDITKGILTLRAVVFFTSVIALFLSIAMLVLDDKKGQPHA